MRRCNSPVDIKRRITCGPEEFQNERISGYLIRSRICSAITSAIANVKFHRCEGVNSIVSRIISGNTAESQCASKNCCNLRVARDFNRLFPKTSAAMNTSTLAKAIFFRFFDFVDFLSEMNKSNHRNGWLNLVGIEIYALHVDIHVDREKTRRIQIVSSESASSASRLIDRSTNS